MKKVIKLYRDNIKYIENFFKYEINNGVIEERNTILLNALKELFLVTENMIILKLEYFLFLA